MQSHHHILCVSANHPGKRIWLTFPRMAELEKLGPKYRLALRVARDERWTRLQCDHKGVYADDCIVDRVTKDRIYIVATNDKDLRIRLRKIPGVPSKHFLHILFSLTS